MGNTTQNLAKPIAIIVAVIAAVLLILGIVNACQKVPVGTTYRVSRWNGTETFEYTCNMGGNYEFKHTYNGQIVSASTGKYSVDGDIITFYGVNTFGDQYVHNETIDITQTAGSSTVTSTLIGVGISVLLLDYLLYAVYRRKRAGGEDDNNMDTESEEEPEQEDYPDPEDVSKDEPNDDNL